MYGKLIKGELVVAPLNYLTEDGQMIFNFNKDLKLMKEHGFKEIVKREPEHDPITQYLKLSHYEETDTNIVEVYIVEEKPLTQEEKIVALQEAHKEAQAQLDTVSEAVDFLLFNKMKA